MKVLVVEDEIIIADNICQFLELNGYETFEPSVSVHEALTSIHENQPDVILLDIRLRGESTGIDLGKELAEHFNIPFIYLTSNSDPKTLREAIDSNPSGFLTKPLNNAQLIAAIEIATMKYKSQTPEEKPVLKNIYVNDGKEFVKVLFDDILFLKSDNVYVEIHLKNGDRTVTRSTLSKIFEYLNDDFLQIHRSYIINVNHVKRVGTNTVIVDETEIPVGNKYKTPMFENFKTNANVSK